MKNIQLHRLLVAAPRLLLLLLLTTALPSSTKAYTIRSLAGRIGSPLASALQRYRSTNNINKLKTVIGAHAIYSLVVLEPYGELTIRKMKAVPSPDELKDRDGNEKSATPTTTTTTPSRLRRTVSKRSNLVTKSSDRLLWNLWIASNVVLPQKPSPEEHPVRAETIRSLCETETTTTDPKGNNNNSSSSSSKVYQFSYRTSMTFEEKYALLGPLWSLRRFVFAFEEFSRMTISSAQQPGSANNVEGIASATMSDNFVLLGGLIRMRPTWKGSILESNQSPGAGYGYHIQWTSVTIELLFPWNRRQQPHKVLIDPPRILKRAKTPWDVVKTEDGLVCFRKGTEGYLVYDSKH